ncbi:hypothetical protein [Mesorhizobium silamurunense]|uniref:hypothetical protein n=1 Tax=Mesorhizobium silamurunense TaxID=499528 RepID=UPI001780C061|nr:hypothetical protein [Mesorhizobium silamurunense]
MFASWNFARFGRDLISGGQMRFEMRFGAVLLGASLLAGCTSAKEGQWNTAQAAMQGSPAFKRGIIADCTKQIGSRRLEDRQTVAKLMNVSIVRVPAAFCNRFFNAWASGRLTYRDIQGIHSQTADNSRFVRVLQGRE